MIRKADRELKTRWSDRFAALPPDARIALADALHDLRLDARARSEHCWKKSKCTMAWYWRCVSIYAGHLAAAVRRVDRR